MNFPAKAFLLKPVISSLVILALALGSVATGQAAVLINLDFNDGGAAVGDNITSTANTGTLGGTATGTNFGAGSVKYGIGPTGALGAVFVDANAPGGVNAAGGRIQYTMGSGEIAATSDWTLMAAFRLDTGNQVSFDRLVDGFVVLINTSGDLTLRFDLPTAIASGSSSSPVLNENEWYHFAMTYDYDGSTNATRAYSRYYINGVEVASQAFAQKTDFSAGRTFTLGSQAAGTRPLNGAMDSLRFYNEHLSTAQVEAAYLQAIPEPNSLLAVLMGAGLILHRVRRQRRKLSLA